MINTPTTESENKISNPVVADQIQYRKRIFDKLKLEDKDKIWYSHHKYMDIVNELEPLFNNFSAENIGTSKIGNGADRNFRRMDWFFPKKNKEKIHEALKKVLIGQYDVTKTLREDYGIDHSREKNQVTGYDIIFGDQGLSGKFMSLLKKIGKQEAAQLVSDLKNEIKVYQICNNLIIEGDSKSIKLLMNFFDETYGNKILDIEKITASGTHQSNIVQNKQNEIGLKGRIMIISDLLSEEYEGDKGIWNSSKKIKHELKHSIDKTIGINYMGYNKYADNFVIEKVLAMEILAFDWQDSNISKKELGTILINGYLREVTMIQKDENMFINVNDSGQYSIDRTKEYSFTGKSIESSIRKQADGFCEKLNGLLYALYSLKKTTIQHPQLGLNDSKINILLSITPASMRKKLSSYYYDLGCSILRKKRKEGFDYTFQDNGPIIFYPKESKQPPTPRS